MQTGTPSTTLPGSKPPPGLTTTTTKPTPPTTKPVPVTTDGVTLSQGAIRPGGKLTFAAVGFKPGTKVTVELHSDPILLTTLTATADGTVTAELTIPASAPVGDHHVVASGTGQSGAPLERAAPLNLDDKAPQVHWVTVTPDTAGPGDTLTIRGRFTDAGGVKQVSFQAKADNGGYSYANFCQGQAQLDPGGTSQDGTWTLTCTIPATVNSGPYLVEPFAVDTVNNWLNTNNGPRTDVKGRFTVDGGTTDWTAPQVHWVTVTPDTAGPGDTLTIRGRFTDAGGVKQVSFQAKADNGGYSYANFCQGQAQLDPGGTSQDGTWTLTCTIPATVNSGPYLVEPFAVDTVNNWLNTNNGPRTDVKGRFTVA